MAFNIEYRVPAGLSGAAAFRGGMTQQAEKERERRLREAALRLQAQSTFASLAERKRQFDLSLADTQQQRDWQLGRDQTQQAFQLQQQDAAQTNRLAVLGVEQQNRLELERVDQAGQQNYLERQRQTLVEAHRQQQEMETLRPDLAYLDTNLGPDQQKLLNDLKGLEDSVAKGVVTAEETEYERQRIVSQIGKNRQKAAAEERTAFKEWEQNVIPPEQVEARGLDPRFTWAMTTGRNGVIEPKAYLSPAQEEEIKQAAANEQAALKAEQDAAASRVEFAKAAHQARMDAWELRRKSEEALMKARQDAAKPTGDEKYNEGMARQAVVEYRRWLDRNPPPEPTPGMFGPGGQSAATEQAAQPAGQPAADPAQQAQETRQAVERIIQQNGGKVTIEGQSFPVEPHPSLPGMVLITMPNGEKVIRSANEVFAGA